MNDSDVIRLRHMLEAAEEAILFLGGRSLPDLRDDRMLTLALAKELEIIGEAAGKVSTGGRSMAPRFHGLSSLECGIG